MAGPAVRGGWARLPSWNETGAARRSRRAPTLDGRSVEVADRCGAAGDICSPPGSRKGRGWGVKGVRLHAAATDEPRCGASRLDTRHC